jgi:hypothetical protein
MNFLVAGLGRTAPRLEPAFPGLSVCSQPGLGYPCPLLRVCFGGRGRYPHPAAPPLSQGRKEDAAGAHVLAASFCILPGHNLQLGAYFCHLPPCSGSFQPRLPTKASRILGAMEGAGVERVQPEPCCLWLTCGESVSPPPRPELCKRRGCTSSTPLQPGSTSRLACKQKRKRGGAGESRSPLSWAGRALPAALRIGL